MISAIVCFLAAYGIVFGLMQKKAAWLTEPLKRWQFFAALLTCPYCLGFHAGWMVWVLGRLPGHISSSTGLWETVDEAVLYAFCGAAFCYLVDTLAVRIER
jgi:hypothetical protein